MITQRKYDLDIMKDTCIEDYLMKFPFPKSVKLSFDEGELLEDLEQ